VDIVEPDQPLTLAQYQELAYAAIDGIQDRGRIPLLVGGTGLYVRAVLEGWTIPRVSPDGELREKLYAEAEATGHEALHQRLCDLDPEAAQRIDARNVRRVVRALEVYYRLGKPISSVQRASPPPYRILRVGLTMSRRLLYQRIDERIERMVSAGLVDEVRALVERGFGYDLPAMSGLGYRQVGMYLRGELPLEEAVALIRRHTRRFVRQQATWFRQDDPRIVWFDASEPVFEAVLACINRFLGAG
jgi:tRNA dimethylallyltransferase